VLELLQQEVIESNEFHLWEAEVALLTESCKHPLDPVDRDCCDVVQPEAQENVRIIATGRTKSRSGSCDEVGSAKVYLSLPTTNREIIRAVMGAFVENGFVVLPGSVFRQRGVKLVLDDKFDATKGFEITFTSD
jgi:hypothetical protein